MRCVPGKHLFSFLDMGNFKFMFPGLHKAFYTRRYGKQVYHERYVECRNGLIGDIEVEKAWHQHFSWDELSALLELGGFKVTAQDGYGYWHRPLTNLRFFIPPRLATRMDRWIDLDAQRFENAEIFVTAAKVGS